MIEGSSVDENIANQVKQLSADKEKIVANDRLKRLLIPAEGDCQRP